jgi:glycosyltransferase involved in cell wall biosynthesis
MNRRPAVVIPVFQAQQDYDETMLSLARSTVSCTVFAVDDGSTPPLDTSKVYPQIEVRLIRLPRNRGIVEALNAGMKAALDGGFDYIARIDAGDFATPERLARQMEYFDNHPHCMLVGCDAVVRDEDGSYRYNMEPPRDPKTLALALHERAWLLHPGVMYRGALFGDLQLYSGEFAAAEDYELFLRIAQKYEIGVVPEPLLIYITRTGSISARRVRIQAVSRLRIQMRYFLWTRWICYYGVLSTLVTLILPGWFKHAFKKRFIYSGPGGSAGDGSKESTVQMRARS